MRKLAIKTAILATTLTLSVSCGTPKLAYFQDIPETAELQSKIESNPIRVRLYDRISIVVNSKDPQLADLFNLPVIAHRVGMQSNTYSYGNQQVSSYTIDSEGNIDFPVLGKVYIAGLTREEISEKIKAEIISQSLIKDPIVIVEFGNLTVSVLGEVVKPGQYAINKDNLTVLDALGMAGDLKIDAERNNVLVIRRNEGETITYKLDLTSLQDITSSPGFILQQDDVIYVSPNKKRQRESTVNGNNMRSTSFWISLSTLAVTIANLIF